MEKTCKNCKWGHGELLAQGTKEWFCQRFPKNVNVWANYVCGEHKPKKDKKYKGR